MRRAPPPFRAALGLPINQNLSIHSSEVPVQTYERLRQVVGLLPETTFDPYRNVTHIDGEEFQYNQELSTLKVSGFPTANEPFRTSQWLISADRNHDQFFSTWETRSA